MPRPKWLLQFLQRWFKITFRSAVILFLAIYGAKFAIDLNSSLIRCAIKRKPMTWPISFRSFIHIIGDKNTVVLPSKEGKEKDGTLADLINLIPETRENTWYWSNALLFNGHLQTIKAAVGNFEQVDKVYYGRRLLTWEDGSTVSADYLIPAPSSDEKWQQQLKYVPIIEPPPLPVRTRYLTEEEVQKLDNDGVADAFNSDNTSDTSRPLLIALHGLSGGSHESYVRATLSKISSPEYGFDCVVLNSRGCARTKITTPQLFCAIWTDDIRNFVKHIKKTQPNRRIFLVGYSLGASILANYLGQEGENTVIDAAAIVANPWDLGHSGASLEDSILGRNLYSPQMAKNLLRLIKNHSRQLKGNDVFDAGVKKLKNIKFISDFDDAFTAPFFGFDTSYDYYRSASSVNRLMNIKTPSLVLNALDDPIVNSKGLPCKEIERNPFTQLVATDLGGHLGWFQNGNERWFPNVLAQYFKNFNDLIDSDLSKIDRHVSRPKRLLVGDRLVVSKSTEINLVTDSEVEQTAVLNVSVEA